MTIVRHLWGGLAWGLLSASALAALGRAPHTPEPAAPVVSAPASQQQALPADSLYTMHQTVLPTGTVVREFATRSGQVFALSWVGPLLPDLGDFFGEYFQAYQEAVQQKRARGVRGGAVQVRQPHLVVVSLGRMGRFEGHAYVPALVPAGVDVDALLR